MTDNHTGKKFNEIKNKFPEAVRFHWHENAFNVNDCYWMVGFTSYCADNTNTCIVWIDVKIEEI